MGFSFLILWEIFLFKRGDGPNEGKYLLKPQNIFKKGKNLQETKFNRK